MLLQQKPIQACYHSVFSALSMSSVSSVAKTSPESSSSLADSSPGNASTSRSFLSHGPGADSRFINGIGSRIQLSFNPGQYVTEFAELGLDRREYLPYFTGALFYGQGSETHPQTGQDGGQGCGPGNNHPVCMLKFFEQTGLPEHFRVQTFSGQEQDCKVGGCRRLNITVCRPSCWDLFISPMTFMTLSLVSFWVLVTSWRRLRALSVASCLLARSSSRSIFPSPHCGLMTVCRV